MSLSGTTSIVGSGCMEIRTRGRMKAYLGSCVGLALLDTKRRIGGMLHILLPEPVCDVPSSQLYSYASTGVPLFLKALFEHGAGRDNLGAFVAGGAILDPSCRIDVVLNIGGRTLDLTLRILKEHGIPIRQLEASGFTGMCIMLDVDRATCTIEPVIEEAKAKRFKEIPVPTLAEIGRTIEDLKPIPQIAISLSEMLADERSDLARIASEIKKDQVLAADVLRLCNSPYTGLPRRIDSIDEAVTFLGTSTLMQLVVTAHMERIMGCTDNGYSLMRGGLYFHSLAVARLCERLARISGVTRPDIAYTAGLLHDIGKVVLDQFMASIKPLFYRILNTHGGDSCSLERRVFGLDHSIAGFHLAEKWRLPDIVKDAVLFHHEPARSENNRGLVHLVHLADTLSITFLPGLVADNITMSASDDSVTMLGLDNETVEKALDVLIDIY